MPGSVILGSPPRGKWIVVHDSGNTAVATLQFPGGGPLYQDLIHFNSPYFVLRPGERLFSGVYTVYVTGYLLTNRSFLPDVERN
jgi:hypothetical protein